MVKKDARDPQDGTWVGLGRASQEARKELRKSQISGCGGGCIWLWARVQVVDTGEPGVGRCGDETSTPHKGVREDARSTRGESEVRRHGEYGGLDRGQGTGSEAGAGTGPISTPRAPRPGPTAKHPGAI